MLIVGVDFALRCVSYYTSIPLSPTLLRKLRFSVESDAS